MDIKNFIRRLPQEYKHIHHYWDLDKKSIVAKLLPGDYYTTQKEVWIATTVASCITVTLWDEQNKVGGMNHFMLPTVGESQDNGFNEATRYGNFAMEFMINDLLKLGADKHALVAKVFGGAKVISNFEHIGTDNITFIKKYLKREDIEVLSSDVGGDQSRAVFFNPTTGDVLARQIKNTFIDPTGTNTHPGTPNHSLSGPIELF